MISSIFDLWTSGICAIFLAGSNQIDRVRAHLRFALYTQSAFTEGLLFQ